MEYGHNTNEWFGKDVSHYHSSMQIDMNLLKCRQLCKAVR